MTAEICAELLELGRADSCANRVINKVWGHTLTPESAPNCLTRILGADAPVRFVLLANRAEIIGEGTETTLRDAVAVVMVNMVVVVGRGTKNDPLKAERTFPLKSISRVQWVQKPGGFAYALIVENDYATVEFRVSGRLGQNPRALRRVSGGDVEGLIRQLAPRTAPPARKSLPPASGRNTATSMPRPGASPAGHFCSSCGTQLQTSNRFCPGCGSGLR
jgi:hypothetical protein